MIYFAQRASNIYIEQLSKLREIQRPVNIFSVIGGLSFLHSLGDRTRSLILVDQDPDASPYCQMILKLLKKSSSGQEFFELLTNHKVSNTWWKPGSFLEPRDLRSKAKQYLADSALVELYDSTYGAMRFDPKEATGWIGDSTIKFYGENLTPMTFCWKMGSAAFSSDLSFNDLKACLGRITPQFIQGRFEELDLEYLMRDLEGETVLLVSNAESPLFSSADNIFRCIQNKISKPVRYISWHRNIEILPREQLVQRGLQELHVALSGQSCFSVRGLCGVAEVNNLPEGSFVYENLEDLRKSIHYGWGTFFIDCSCSAESDFEHKLGEILKATIPCFTHIIFWGRGSIGTIMQTIEAVHMINSYNLSKLNWYAECYLMSWELKGCVEALQFKSA